MPASTGDRLQRSKLMRPSSAIWELWRPRLVERLNEGGSAPLSIICGMAGAGKTTLARQWASQLSTPSGWITLDEGDNELERFVLLMIAAIRVSYPTFGSVTLGELQFGKELSAEDIATIIGNEMVELDEPIRLVIDDLHTIHNAAIYDFLLSVFRVPPPNLHICVVSRTDPPLPLTVYRARYQFAEIRLEQLLLSLDDTREFLLDITHANLSPEAVRKLHEETEGWITGLHLTALAMRNAVGEPDLDLLLRRASIDAMEFLANEMVERVPESVQHRMLLLAVPERINAELGWHLLNSSHDDTVVDVNDMLTHLETNGYFLVSLGEHHTWYRFHSLFRAALLETAERRFGANSIRNGHRLAAEWLSANRFVDQAVRHALAAEDIEQAASLVEQHAQYALATDNWLSLESWLRQLPESIRSQRIELILAQAWIFQIRGKHQEILPLLNQVKSLLASGAQRSPADRNALDAEIELLDVVGRIATVDGTVLREVGEKSWQLMAPRERAGVGYGLFYFMIGCIEENRSRTEEPFRTLGRIVAERHDQEDFYSVFCTLWARTNSGFAHLWFGDLDRSDSEFGQVLSAGEPFGFSRTSAQARAALGWSCLQRNQLESAATYFQAAVEEPLLGILVKKEALCELARTEALIANHSRSDAVVSRLVDLLYAVNWPFSIPLVQALRADIAFLRGDHLGAVRWAESTTPAPELESLASVVSPALIKARILLSEPMGSPGHLHDASAMLGVLAGRLETQPIHRLWIAVRTLQAVILDRTGSPSAALRLLSETIDAANGHIRPFLDQGAPFTRLLERLVEREGRFGFRALLLDASRAEASHVSTSGARELPLPPAPWVAEPRTGAEQLSTREREVLGLLAARLSNKEIAEALDISPLTVKRHTINLYAKLGVNSRRQAARAYDRLA